MPIDKNMLIREKVDQAISILQEQNIDLWLTFVRETSAVRDPILPYIYGHDVTWQSAFLLTRSGERIAIVGHFDAETTRRMGVYSEVIGYHEAFRPALVHVLQRLNPAQIALNYSTDDSHADGLTHGLFLLLQKHLHGTPLRPRSCPPDSVRDGCGRHPR